MRQACLNAAGTGVRGWKWEEKKLPTAIFRLPTLEVFLEAKVKSIFSITFKTDKKLL